MTLKAYYQSIAHPCLGVPKSAGVRPSCVTLTVKTGGRPISYNVFHARHPIGERRTKDPFRDKQKDAWPRTNVVTHDEFGGRYLA